MKRPRSYGEDLDDKGIPPSKDWGRRDSDRDKDRDRDRSSDRRFWRGSGSRRRYEEETDAYERRKDRGGFDRYWDGVNVSSSYGGERIRRSESLTVSKREFFPKGFRSERDRSRREGSSSWSSWRRSQGVEDEVRSGSGTPTPVEKVSRVRSVDRCRSRSKDSSSGEPSRSVEIKKKPVEVRKDSVGDGGRGGLEEGELEPDPEPVRESKPDPTPAAVAERRHEVELEPQVSIAFDKVSDNNKSSSVERLDIVDKEDASVTKETNDFVLELETIKKDKEEPCSTPAGLSDHRLNKVDVENSVVVQKVVELTHRMEPLVEDVEESMPSLPSLSYETARLKNEKLLEEVGEHSRAGISSSPSKIDVDLHETEVVKELNESEPEQCKENGEIRTVTKLDACLNKGKISDLQAERVNATRFVNSSDEEVASKNMKNEVTLDLLTRHTTEINRDKGKSLAVSLSNETHSVEHDNMEGPSTRGFELVFSSETMRQNKVNNSGITIDKHRYEKGSFEPLALSLGLPGISSDHPFNDPDFNRSSPGRPRKIHSIVTPHTNSDGFAASVSISGSQSFFHNPSCSLTQNSTENYEHSVGSFPAFQVTDQLSDSTVWRGKSLTDLKEKAVEVPFRQKLSVSGNFVHQSYPEGQLIQKPSGMPHQTNLFRSLSYANNLYKPRSDFNEENKVLSRHRSSSSLIGREQQIEPVVPNGVGDVDKLLAKIVAEPLQEMERIIQGMTELQISYLKENITMVCTRKNRHGEFCSLQEALRRRPDLKLETLSSCHRSLLEMLVALKTGIADFLRSASSIPSSDLAEIFLNLKCRNIACRSALPVDECDCKVCLRKSGFCSMCMCIVCHKFDLAFNTCSWIGCDFCLHWCHTDCALRESHIKNDASITGLQGTELQFYCIACDHPSEMFGFVKDVFKVCAKDWNAETLAKELKYVMRIFSASTDPRGRRLSEVANHLFLKLENNTNFSEVCNCIMGVLAEFELNLPSSPAILPPKEDVIKDKEVSSEMLNNAMGYRSKHAVGSSSQPILLPSISTKQSALPDITGPVVSRLDCAQLARQVEVTKSQKSLEKKPSEDELESVIKFKEAESKLYQARADDARREAEALKRIVVSKNEKIDAEYATGIAKLCLLEAEEKRRQKHEEYLALEQAQRDYFSMKIRMEAEIKELILKMEATKHNINA